MEYGHGLHAHAMFTKKFSRMCPDPRKFLLRKFPLYGTLTQVHVEVIVQSQVWIIRLSHTISVIMETPAPLYNHLMHVLCMSAQPS